MNQRGVADRWVGAFLALVLVGCADAEDVRRCIDWCESVGAVGVVYSKPPGFSRPCNCILGVEVEGLR